MSYPMVHLKVAYELLARYGGRIERPGDFLLSSVAPDAVHFHNEYDVSMKERSHLWKFGPRWGITIDSEGWRDTIYKFWKEHQNAENRDFIAGYCVHLLTDWENDRSIWTPFREKMMQGTEVEEVHERYAAEAYGYDQWLYQTDEDKEEIWQLLGQGRTHGVEGCILEEDLARQKRSLLFEQFTGEKVYDVSGYQFCTKDVMGEFVKKCVEEIFDFMTLSEDTNPWEEISLSDYENHMKLDSVMQLQNMNQMMKSQFGAYPVNSVMILGIAGGNGLEHIDKNKFQKVYGIDINEKYLTAVEERYSDISDILECIQLNLMEEADRLPKAELLVANLLIEYIGYDCFKKAVEQVQPQYISCIIQINVNNSWVSDSPYIHVFDDLDKVHHHMEEDSLIQTLTGTGYKWIARAEKPLPNGKKLVQLDFER